jgi:hypothetical protein
MKVLEVDRRTRTYLEDQELVERLDQEARDHRGSAITVAKSLAKMRDKRVYLKYGCISVEDYARRLGYAPNEVRGLLKLADAMKSESSVEERIHKNALTIAAATALAPVLTETSLFDEERSDWLKRAERDSYWKVRRDARRRVAEIRCGEAVECLQFTVPDSVVERFERAQVLASRKAARHLSSDETFEAVVDYFVDKHDPLLVKEGKRRLGPTKEFPDKRYVPLSVKREIRRRAGDTCEFPGCTRRAFLQFAHRRPHRGHKTGRGSGREARDLFLLCNDHHFFQEACFYVPFGPTHRPIWYMIGPHFAGPLVFTKRCPGGRPPETDRERRAIAAIERRERARSEGHGGDRSSSDDVDADDVDADAGGV